VQVTLRIMREKRGEPLPPKNQRMYLSIADSFVIVVSFALLEKLWGDGSRLSHKLSNYHQELLSVQFYNIFNITYILAG
jgi:hypothetical protein